MSKYIDGIRIGGINSILPEKCNFLSNDNCVIISFIKYREDSFTVNVNSKYGNYRGCFHVVAENEASYPLILKMYENEKKFLNKTRDEFYKMLKNFLS